MAIRRAKSVEDVQRVIYYLISKLTSATSPWTKWDVVLGYPDTQVFENFDKPFIYVMAPIVIDKVWQMAGKPVFLWQMTLGCWDDRKTGGDEMINIMGSTMLDFFTDPQTCHTQQFDVTIGGTVYTDTTLVNQGVMVTDINGPFPRFTEDMQEFRTESDLLLKA